MNISLVATFAAFIGTATVATSPAADCCTR